MYQEGKEWWPAGQATLRLRLDTTLDAMAGEKRLLCSSIRTVSLTQADPEAQSVSLCCGPPLPAFPASFFTEHRQVGG